MSKSASDRALALAGVFQAASMVHSIAHRGICDAPARQASIDSLFRFDAEKTIEVYGDISGIRYGLRQLCQNIAHPSEPSPALRYTLTLLKLAKQASRSDMLSTIGNELQSLKTESDDSERLRGLSDLYAKTISQMQPRVIVTGDPALLKDNANTTLIRALLLAGIRSAILWQQSGGTRTYLVFSRKRIVFEAEKLLNHAE